MSSSVCSASLFQRQSPTHHIEEVGQLQETGDIGVDLDGQVLKLFFCWVYSKEPEM